MNKIDKINSWNPPNWHEDFGDSLEELKLLKEICKRITISSLEFDFEMECTEEGYLEILVLKKQNQYMCVTDLSEHKIGLFFEDGREIYIHEPDKVLDFI